MSTHKHSHTFRKKWGQNFLTDSNLLDKIARTIDPESKDRFLEIGPGEGALTEKIYPLVDSMVAIEIDPMLVDKLKRKEILKGIDILQGDILLEAISRAIKEPILCPTIEHSEIEFLSKKLNK